MKLVESDIIYEDNHLIVYNKKSGQLVQGDKTGDVPLIDLMKTFLKEKYQKPGNVFVGMVHRLDRPTSGCVLFTKTSKALPRMQKLFAERKIKKIYLALTKNAAIPLTDTLIHFIQKSQLKNLVACHNKAQRNSQLAELSYQITSKYESTQLIEVHLKTGRKHQIRAQLNKIGAPIVGDLKYGYDVPNLDKSICLHCRELSFIHPVSLFPITIIAEIPEIPEWNVIK